MSLWKGTDKPNYYRPKEDGPLYTTTECPAIQSKKIENLEKKVEDLYAQLDRKDWEINLHKETIKMLVGPKKVIIE